MPTSDSGDPQDDFVGRPLVVAVDDTPSVFLNLRVHLENDPSITGLIAVDQLVLVDEY